MSDRKISLQRYGVSHAGEYVGPGSTRGTIVLIKWGVLHTLYRFNSKTGKGKGQARDWSIAPQDLPRVKTWIKQDLQPKESR